jgi:hypothetical protein
LQRVAEETKRLREASSALRLEQHIKQFRQEAENRDRQVAQQYQALGYIHQLQQEQDEQQRLYLQQQLQQGLGAITLNGSLRDSDVIHSSLVNIPFPPHSQTGIEKDSYVPPVDLPQPSDDNATKTRFINNIRGIFNDIVRSTVYEKHTFSLLIGTVRTLPNDDITTIADLNSLRKLMYTIITRLWNLTFFWVIDTFPHVPYTPRVEAIYTTPSAVLTHLESGDGVQNNPGEVFKYYSAKTPAANIAPFYTETLDWYYSTALYDTWIQRNNYEYQVQFGDTFDKIRNETSKFLTETLIRGNVHRLLEYIWQHNGFISNVGNYPKSELDDYLKQQAAYIGTSAVSYELYPPIVKDLGNYKTHENVLAIQRHDNSLADSARAAGQSKGDVFNSTPVSIPTSPGPPVFLNTPVLGSATTYIEDAKANHSQLHYKETLKLIVVDASKHVYNEVITTNFNNSSNINGNENERGDNEFVADDVIMDYEPSVPENPPLVSADFLGYPLPLASSNTINIPQPNNQLDAQIHQPLSEIPLQHQVAYPPIMMQNLADTHAPIASSQDVGYRNQQPRPGVFAGYSIPMTFQNPQPPSLTFSGDEMDTTPAWSAIAGPSSPRYLPSSDSNAHPLSDPGLISGYGQPYRDPRDVPIIAGPSYPVYPATSDVNAQSSQSDQGIISGYGPPYIEAPISPTSSVTITELGDYDDDGGLVVYNPTPATQRTPHVRRLLNIPSYEMAIEGDLSDAEISQSSDQVKSTPIPMPPITPRSDKSKQFTGTTTPRTDSMAATNTTKPKPRTRGQNPSHPMITRSKSGASLGAVDRLGIPSVTNRGIARNKY